MKHSIITALLVTVAFVTSLQAQTQEVINKAKVEIGRHFFFDTDQSLNRVMSCATCHDPDPKYGYSNGHAIAIGAVGQDPNAPLGVMGIHNTKSLLGCKRLLKHACDADGRAPNLNAACLQAITDPLVLNMPSIEAVIERLNKKPEYTNLVAIAYPGSNILNEFALRDCLLFFLCEINYPNLPADKMSVGLLVDVPESCSRGEKLFKKFCISCHNPETDWTDYEYHNIGWNYRNNIVILQNGQMQVAIKDKVRSTITNDPADDCKVLTPSLRGVIHTAPYFVDGMAKDIKTVVEYKASGGRFRINGVDYADPNRDDMIKAINIQGKDNIADLVDYVELCFQDPANYPRFTNPWVKGLVSNETVH